MDTNLAFKDLYGEGQIMIFFSIKFVSDQITTRMNADKLIYLKLEEDILK